MNIRKTDTILIIITVLFLAIWSIFFIIQSRPNKIDFDNMPLSFNNTNINIRPLNDEDTFCLETSITNIDKEEREIVCIYCYTVVRIWYNDSSSYITNEQRTGLAFPSLLLSFGNTTDCRIFILDLQQNPSRNIDDIVRIECDLYITYVKYTESTDSWGDPNLDASKQHDMIIKEAPRISMPAYIA